MVSTRKHPDSFSSSTSEIENPTLRSTTKFSKSGDITTRTANRTRIWSHTPSNLTLVWLYLSLPLVIWDFSYMFLRPHSMPGGKWHSIWKPYSKYVQVDYVYGFSDFEEGEGFGPAQSFLNVLETALYGWYLWIVTTQNNGSVPQGRGAPDTEEVGWLGKGRSLVGEAAGKACVIGLSASVMTLSKTALYMLREVLGNYQSVGHNDATTLFWFWIIPNGLWVVFPTYMTYVFAREIIQGLEVASGAPLVDDIGVKEE